MSQQGLRPGANPVGSPQEAPSLASENRERPSRHGAILGEALATLAAEGRRNAPDLPEMCATCAFRPGCMTNQMAATGLLALNCVLGIDTDRFACHHGMREGDPTKLCAGYIAAVLAPWKVTTTTLEWLAKQVETFGGPDPIRAEFDAWLAETDPLNTMDDYARGRAWLRAKAASRDGAERVQLGDSGTKNDSAERSK